MSPAARGVGRALGLFGAAAGVYVTTFVVVNAVTLCDSWLCRVSATAFLATAFYFCALGFLIASIIISDGLPRESRKAFWLASLLWLALTAWVLGDTCYRLYRLSVSDETSSASMRADPESIPACGPGRRPPEAIVAAVTSAMSLGEHYLTCGPTLDGVAPPERRRSSPIAPDGSWPPAGWPSAKKFGAGQADVRAGFDCQRIGALEDLRVTVPLECKVPVHLDTSGVQMGFRAATTLPRKRDRPRRETPAQKDRKSRESL